MKDDMDSYIINICGSIDCTLVNNIIENIKEHEESKVYEIFLSINSCGGSAKQAVKLIKYIKNSKLKINTIIEKFANANCASGLIFMSGHERYMNKNSEVSFIYSNTKTINKMNDDVLKTINV